MKEKNFCKVVVDLLKDHPQSFSVLHSKTNAGGREDKDDAFFICDLGDVVRKYDTWSVELPRVRPFYAVKCNNNKAILSVLHKLGAGFDCASKAELQEVFSIGVKPSDIIFANPTKMVSHVKYAARHDVPLMTFDNESELHKVKHWYPDARLVIRILPPESGKCQCPLGIKFGAAADQTKHLLEVAKSLELNVVGVSFHVGSGCYEAQVYYYAVQAARRVFNEAAEVGYDLTLLDIGGGFPGSTRAKITFKEICDVLRPALDQFFPEDMGVSIIAEPGRFMVASACTLVCNIVSKRPVQDEQGDHHVMYYINDGVYMSFNCILYDHQEVYAEALSEHADKKALISSSIWGPTCDGLDCVIKECQLPDLGLGDWLIFKDMGAYTSAAASNFNGMQKPSFYYAIQEDLWPRIDNELCPQEHFNTSCHELHTFEPAPPIAVEANVA